MNNNRLYVGNLPYEATSKELISMFSQFGDIIETMMIPDKFVPGKSKGFGFVTFASNEEAQKALSLHTTEYKGRKIIVQFAKEATPNTPSTSS